ncbi:hypothetical protein PoB_000146400 [Plakobranchus ocellatus]|uniref:SMB domain-containing protein n=1 Tax=Plakobranchus ocellatus TaxID=259542 RepID=A0AAV3XYD6_9GAST|nr:hypothetical protein PoB_000146400 [Plakobranchus ocellatus]
MKDDDDDDDDDDDADDADDDDDDDDMALSNQRNLTTVIILMATTLLLLSGPLLAISPDMSKAHASAESLNTTTVVSEFLDTQTNSMDEENYPTVKWKSTKLRTSDFSSSTDTPQIFQQKKNSFGLATKETNTWTRESKSHMTKRPDFLEDPTGLVRVDADESLEGEPDSLYGGDGTYNRSTNCSGISSPNCTLKQFEKEHIDTNTGDAISEPPMNSFKPDLTLTFTCEGRCGMEMSFPCSCSASCVVYGTCCDNMTQDCPHVWEEGMTKFDHMLGVDIVCHEDRLYMISSCPGSLGKDAEGKEVTLQTSRKPAVKRVNLSLESQSPNFDGVDSTPGTRDIIGFDSGKFSKSGRDVQESIIERLKLVLSAAPVTDSNTGFTFINKSIYDCNNMSQSTALPWSVASEYIAVSPVMLEDLERFNFDNQYQFDFDKEIFKAHQCLHDIVETCSQTAGLEEMNQIHAQKCRESTAIIYSRFKTAFYRNKFCAFCNQGSYDRYSLYLPDKPIFRHESFQVLMSLSESGTINVRIFKPGVSRAVMPWSHAQCSIPDPNTELSSSAGLIEEPANAESDSRDVCSVACINNYFKSPTDGRCKSQHSALLAVADDGLPPLCPSAMKGLANFLVCSLKSEVKSLIYADWRSPSVSTMFDASTNKTLYVVKINFDLVLLTSYVYSAIKDDVIQNIYHVAFLVKSFKTYQSSHNLCSPQDLKKQNLESDLEVIRTSSQSVERYIHNLKLNMTFSEGMEQLRGPIVNRQDTTTVCFSSVYFSHRLKFEYLRCMEDPEHERDKSLLHDFRSSSCFSYLENLGLPDSNGAHTAMPRDAIFLKMLVLAFIILVVAFVKTT